MDKFVEFWNSTLEFEVWQAILCSFIMLGAAFLATFGNWYISKASIREVCYSRMKEKAFQKYFQQQGKLDRILLLQLLWDVPDKAFYAFCWVGWNLLSLAAFPAAVVGAIAFSICQCGWGMALMEIGIITGMAPALLMLIPDIIFNSRERARYSFRKKSRECRRTSGICVNQGECYADWAIERYEYLTNGSDSVVDCIRRRIFTQSIDMLHKLNDRILDKMLKFHFPGKNR